MARVWLDLSTVATMETPARMIPAIQAWDACTSSMTIHVALEEPIFVMTGIPAQKISAILTRAHVLTRTLSGGVMMEIHALCRTNAMKDSVLVRRSRVMMAIPAQWMCAA